jgi:DNA polymerase alpha subunit A
MADLLGEVDANVLPARSYSKKVLKSDTRRKIRVLSPPLTQERKSNVNQSRRAIRAPAKVVDTKLAQFNFDDDDGVLNPGVDDYDLPMSDPMPSSPIAKAVERKAQVQFKEEDDDDELLDVAPALGNEGVASTSVNMTGSRPVPKIHKTAYPSPQQPCI